jgi:malonyl-CoA O-methyltransferase
VNRPEKTLHVEIRGEGADLVLLHGWALHGGAWGPWLDQLATHARLHIVDLPGHGRSPWQVDIHDLRDLARSVAPYVPRGAVVLGWSLGGMVALELSRLRPPEHAGLVLISTTPCFTAREDWSNGMSPDVLRGFADGLAADYHRTIGNFLALQSWGDERASTALRSLRANVATRGEPDPRALVAGLDMLRETDLRDVLRTIAVPALVLAGEHDRITPAAAGRELASRLPSAHFVSIPKAGHAPFLSHPAEVLRPVAEFVTALAMQPREAIDPYTLDAGRVRASFSAAAGNYDTAAVLQTTVRDELLRRLDALRMTPATAIDLGAGTGHASIALKRRYPGARVIAADIALPMLQQAGRRQTLLRRFHRVAADAAALPFGAAACDMLFSNLTFQWCNELDRVLRECRRVIRPGGVLHFTTFGPDTLLELRRAWQQADGRHAHVSRFLDMHDIGDALVRAGFAEPVLDVERYTLTYADAPSLMRDLKTIGAHNATAGRARGLTGKRTWGRALEAYEHYRRDGRLPATYEVVFAQAWVPEGPIRTRASAPDGEVRVPLSQLRRR